MKVLHVVPSLSPELGGPTEVAMQLCAALRRRGVDIEIATTNDNGSKEFDYPCGAKTEVAGVPVWFFKRSAIRRKEYILSAPFTWWLISNIRRYELVQTEYLFCYSTSCATLLSRLFSIPYVVRTTGQLSPWALRQGALRKTVYAGLLDRPMLRSAAMIHCTSKGEIEDLRAFGVSTPADAIPLGVTQGELVADAGPELRSWLGVAPGERVMVYLSRLHHKKRPEWIIECVKQLRSEGKNVSAIIAGTGEDGYVGGLVELARSLGVSESVHFIGFVSGERKQLVLQGADIFVLPSHSENFGLAVVEALAVGLPVVLTPGVQIARDIADAGAGECCADSLSEFCSTVSDILENGTRRAAMSECAKSLAQERFSWDAAAEAVYSHYQRILCRGETRG